MFSIPIKRGNNVKKFQLVVLRPCVWLTLSEMYLNTEL